VSDIQKNMNIKIGDTVSLTKTITEDDVQKFGELTGDFNPVHFDEEFARNTRFGKRIAHGMLSASLISGVLGNKLPGTIYLSQTLKFTAPVYLGDTVTVRATVTNIREDKPIVTLETICTNQNGDTVIKGEAVVLVQ
jgi:3-hydroxybutyryl-CoA dehydratase